MTREIRRRRSQLSITAAGLRDRIDGRIGYRPRTFPRTRDSLDALVANVRIAQSVLPVPLALEPIAALVAWPPQ